VLSLLFLALAAGSAAYCALTVIAALRYRGVRPSRVRNGQPVSILKPLAGVDDGLEENLRSFFEQDYAQFEILFAVRASTDPAVPVVERLCAEYPHIPTRLIVTGEPPYANAKVFSLDTMLAAASHNLIVMADSDTRVTPDMLPVLAGEFEDPRTGMATCPYRAVPGRSVWSTLEALGLNTEFIGGVLMARMLDGMKFAIGPTIAARRETLARIGGFDALKEFLAEDFVMGKLAAQCGCGVILSSYVIEHHIGAQRMKANIRHRLRWARSTRRSRPRGYVGQLFTHPLPLALLAFAAAPAWWPVAAAALALRFASAWVTAEPLLRDPLTRRFWWLLPIQDMFSFGIWIGGFFGNTILWRGHKYYLLPDGRFELIPATIVLDEPA
jgi:ceramide glucosyltransferase